ncbi:MAG: AarF/ABC1/UbiB kinase family protein [Hydrococcus sp. Prado102]|jgi:predicted unusual protein kinase regulating ubiquinone biosynthesis (AarF/ABC1/UbiB family)|nr:AarF/ABC1/UbiB kinase family protein [Hydrococcus sp. Prado102]
MLVSSQTSKPLLWQRSQYSPLARQLEVSIIVTQFIFYLSWDKLTANNSTRRRHRRARWLVKKLLDLGPTFIKIGQSLSTRADLIPIEYVQELQELQDRVPPFGIAEAIAVIESELGKPINILFEEFESVPLASASLGQVHKAKLHSGEEVVIKVQRPGLEGLFNLDFEVLHQVVRTGKRYLPDLKKYDLEAIYQEFFELLFQEIDYVHEGKNAERFRENFKSYSRIKVPTIYWQYTTKKILTLEYLPGIKVDDRPSLEAQGINLDNIIQLGICSYLKQLLIDGFFQSDPHPGNMAVSLSGDLIFYDFGTMAEVKSASRNQMVETFFAVLQKDTEKVVETMICMGLIEPMPDMTPVKRIVAFLLEEFRDKPVDIKAFEKVGEEVYLMFKQQPFRLPAQMTFIIKSITTLDGIARALDPQYNLLAASQPFVKSLAIASGRENLVGTLAKGAKNYIKNKWRQPSATERYIRRLEEKIERGELQFRVRSLESERTLKRIYKAIKCLLYGCLMGLSLFCAILLLSSIYSKFAIIAFGLSGLWGLFLLKSLIVLAIQERIDR